MRSLHLLFVLLAVLELEELEVYFEELQSFE